MARRGARGVRSCAGARLPHAAGCLPAPDVLSHRLQPPGGPPLPAPRPKDPYRMSATTPLVALAAEPAVATKPSRVLTTIRRRPATLIGGFILLAFVLVAILGPLLTPYGIHQQ